MESNRARSVAELRVDELRRLDLLCDEYEKELRAGRRPELEPFLSRTPPDLTHVLRSEMALLEVEILEKSGVQSDEVARRLGVNWSEVADLVGGRKERTETGSGSATAQNGFTHGGQRLGGYILGDKLSDGGMGSVYRARHLHLGRLVAIKLIRSDLASQSVLAARFKREMRLIGELEHPNVVEALDGGEQEGQLYLVMRLLDGIDLSRLVARYGPLRAADAAEIIRQAALGLQYLHERGLVHRDIKPSNLFLTHDGTVKLLDLGLARSATNREKANDELTSAGVVLGTVDFIAPEQQVDPAGVTIAADIYALGGALYVLLAGRTPFHDHASASAKLVAHRSEAPPDLRPVLPQVPDGLLRVVERMLAKDPASRYREPREVAEALAPFVEGADLRALACFPAGVPSATPLSVWAARVRPPARRTAAWIAAAGLAAALLLTFGWIHHIRHEFAGDNYPGPRPAAGESTDRLAIRSFRVNHYARSGDSLESRGELGRESFATDFGDQVRVSAELSEVGYCYLLALNTDGSVQPAWPEGKQAPVAQRRLVFPGPGEGADLNDDPRGGLQAFVLVVSEKPFPPFREWRASTSDLGWRHLPCERMGVWRGDGVALEEMRPGAERVHITDLAGIGVLARAVERLRRSDGVTAVAVVAFSVRPQRKP